MYKNVASQKVTVYATTLSTGAAKTGDAANITAYYQLDGGTVTVTNDTNPTELSSTNMPGLYEFDMLQAETNGDLFKLYAKSSTSGVSLEPVVIYTRAATLAANVTQWNGTNVATPDTAGYPKITIKDGTGPGELSMTSGAIDGMALEATLTDMKGAGFDTADHSLVALKSAVSSRSAPGDQMRLVSGTGAGELDFTNGVVEANMELPPVQRSQQIPFRGRR